MIHADVLSTVGHRPLVELARLGGPTGSDGRETGDAEPRRQRGSEAEVITRGHLDLPTLEQVAAAADLIRGVLLPTPQINWPLLSARCGVHLWVKHENHNPTGAFKVRGGLTYLADLKRRAPEVAGVVAATRGNHGQSIALAAGRIGLPATIVVPYGNSRAKNAAMRGYGAKLIEHG
jgi:threonine dehydratase